jgi:hypothetical protein
MVTLSNGIKVEYHRLTKAPQEQKLKDEMREKRNKIEENDQCEARTGCYAFSICIMHSYLWGISSFRESVI